MKHILKTETTVLRTTHSRNVANLFVLRRKNKLFSDTPEGADTSALIYSIVETAKVNNINIYHYLKYLLEKTSFKNYLMKNLNHFLHGILM